jgi:hypothetical protein
MQNFDKKCNLTEYIRFVQLSQGKNAKFSVRHNINIYIYIYIYIYIQRYRLHVSDYLTHLSESLCKEKQKEQINDISFSTVLLFILYKRPMMDYLINPKYVAYTSERKYMLCLTENLAFVPRLMRNL